MVSTGLLLSFLSAFGFVIGKYRALSFLKRGVRLHSLPGHYGLYISLWTFLMGCAGLFIVYLAARHFPHLKGPEGWQIILIFGTLTLLSGYRNVRGDFKARLVVEGTVKGLLFFAAAFAIIVTLMIIASMFLESLRFFKTVPLYDFLFGLHWSPQTASETAQLHKFSHNFGAVPLFTGTLLITLIAMVIAAPLGLFAAIYMSFYTPPRSRHVVKPLLEMLAGIPTIVYGFFAVTVIAPFIRSLGLALGVNISSEGALIAGVVMGIMIVPFISSLSDDVLSSIPKPLLEGSLALGATLSETIRRVMIPAALPGLVSSILLAISRAVGETMLVVMAAGLAAQLTFNPLKSVTTVTVQIVNLLTGDQTFDSAKTLAAFAIGLMLFLTTLVLNIIALHVVNKYRTKYD